MTRRPNARILCISGAVAAAGLCGVIAACSGNSQRTAADEARAGITIIARGDSVVVRELPGLTVLERIDPLPPAAPAVAEAPALPSGGGYYKLGRPYQMAGSWYTPQEDPDYDEVGRASWYGGQFHGRLTANGEVFDKRAISAAHPTLPLPSYVRVTNLQNDRSIVVRVNDRGPYKYNRLIDLSERAAELLGFKRAGRADVRVEYVDKAPLDGNDQEFLLASYSGPEIEAPAQSGIMLASAGAARGEPGRAMVQPAAYVASRPDGAAERNRVRATTVAFAPDMSDDAGEMTAMQAVTSGYAPEARIVMAFETASQAEF